MPIFSGLRSAGLALAVLLVALVFRPAQAEAERIRLNYTLYIGYFSALDVTATIALADDGYRIEALVAPQSWIAWALPWTARSFADGRIDDGAIRPDHHHVTSSWGSRTRHTDIEFSTGGVPQVTFDPPVPDGSREPVPDALRIGAIDPVSAVAAMAEAARGDRGCVPVMPVFDGRRRFDIRSAAQAGVILPASSFSAYAGPVTACRLTFVTVAGGYRGGERSRFWQSAKDGGGRPPVEIWLAALGPNLPPLPVYAGGESILGWVTVYLSAFKIEGE